MPQARGYEITGGKLLSSYLMEADTLTSPCRFLVLTKGVSIFSASPKTSCTHNTCITIRKIDAIVI